ncbi:hypothetical protein [uncultured Alistipes sp.]|uniref:hypothetical protein n=1 Tax=Alistipes sp. TaxID=1872444 RepID=UPI0025982485|nr:hypothetical protein [uncultured Alistipes sp.]
MKIKNPDSSPATENWERNTRDCVANIQTKTMQNKYFFKKVFSTQRMERYYTAYPDDENKALAHYQANIQLSSSFYACLSVFEVALRNALNRELTTLFGRDDWYKVLSTRPGLNGLNYYITEAQRHISKRGEIVNASKIVAELTFGFWVSLMNSQYEKILWHDLRRAFPYMPKVRRKRKNISAPLNNFRAFRNRVFHNEPICWNKDYIENIHQDILEVLGWINKEIPGWLAEFDTVNDVLKQISEKLGWQ